MMEDWLLYASSDIKKVYLKDFEGYKLPLNMIVNNHVKVIYYNDVH